MLRRLATALLVATLVLPRTARADDTPSAADQTAYVDVVVDGVASGRHAIVLASDGDVAIRTEDAGPLNLPGRETARRSIGARAYYSLRALAPDVRFAFDEVALRLTIDVAPQLIGARTVALDDATPPDGLDRSRPPSAFANYFLSRATDAGVSGFVEAGASAADRLLYTSGSLANGTALRGETYLAIDDQARTRRLQFGDTATEGDELISDASFFGVSTRRAFELDPYAYRFPSPVVSGIVAAPATADVYVNGVVARTIPLLPGGFDLTNLPVGTGRNDVAVVVRDASGVVQTYSQAYYRTDTLLRKGLTDYTYGTGFVRGPGTMMDYGSPAAFATYRLGATNAATYGVRAVAAAGDRLGELDADLRIPIGGVHLGVATSDAARVRGVAYDGSVTLQAAASSLSASFSARTAGFRDLATQPLVLQPPIGRTSLALSQEVTRAVSFVMQSHVERFVARPMQRIVSLGIDAMLGRATTLSLSVQRSQVGAGVANTFATLSLVRSLGRGRTLVASTDRGTGATSTVQYRSDATSSETGFGYGVRYDRSALGGQGETDAVEHAPFADLSALLQQAPGGKIESDVALAGGLASVGGRTLWTRPIGDAFALVDAGEPGLDVSLDGRPVGRTNRRGDVIVGSLSPYAENRIAVGTDGLALDREVRLGQRIVSPGFRGGTIAKLAVETVHYAIGTIRLGGGPGPGNVPADGFLVLDAPGRHASSPLDDDGRYYFENLAPGTYAARVRSLAGSCTFAFVVPPDGGRVASDLGTVRCVATPAS